MITLHPHELIPLALALGVVLAVCMRRATQAGRTEVLNSFRFLSCGENPIEHAGESYVIVPQKVYRALKDAPHQQNEQVEGLKKINARQMELIRSYDKRKADEMKAQRREYDEYLRDCEQGKAAIERALQATSLDLTNVRAERDKLAADNRKLWGRIGNDPTEVDRLKEQVRNFSNDSSRLRAEKGTLEETIRGLQGEIDELNRRHEEACGRWKAEEQRLADAYNAMTDDALKAEAEVKRLQVEMANFVVRHNELAAAHRARLQKLHGLGDELLTWACHGFGKPCPVELVADKPTVLEGVAIVGADSRVHIVPEGELG